MIVKVYRCFSGGSKLPLYHCPAWVVCCVYVSNVHVCVCMCGICLCVHVCINYVSIYCWCMYLHSVGGEPTNCTSNSECGLGYFCLRNCPVDDYPAHVAFLSSPLSLQGQSSLFVPSSRYPAYSGGDFTVVARFRQDPTNSGYLLYYSVDSQTHTFGILLNATENLLRILYTPPLPNTAHSFKTINLGIPINDNAYHTLAVVVNSKNTGYHVETIIDGSYAGGFDNDISIDTVPRVRIR